MRGVGKRFEAKDVADGYARNFLLPRKLAEIATASALTRLAAREKKETAARERRRASLTAEAERLRAVTLSFPAAVGEKGELFGSVTARDIKESLEEQGFAVETVHLKEPLKTLGTRAIEVELGEGIETTVVVTVVRKE